MVLGLGIGGAMFTTVLAQTQQAGPTPGAIVEAADAGLLAAAAMAFLGALASATRDPGRVPR